MPAASRACASFGRVPCLHPAEPDARALKAIFDFVKGFGCRPLTGVRHTPAAGVRKPPKDETAMGSGWRCRGHYGDLAAATEEVGCRRGDGSQRWLACGCVIGWLLRLLKYLHGSNDEGRSND